jgi:hypothetical protein
MPSLTLLIEFTEDCHANEAAGTDRSCLNKEGIFRLKLSEISEVARPGLPKTFLNPISTQGNISFRAQVPNQP